MELISQHKFLSLVVLLLLIGAAWWEFTGTATPSTSLTTTGGATSTEEAQLVSTLLELQTVNLNGTVLNDSGFLALQDFTTQVVSEPLGRPNPFAPISGGAVSAAPTSTPNLNPNLFAPAKH